MYAPEIDSLLKVDLAFVQDVAEENDGVNYLLVVIDVLSKYVQNQKLNGPYLLSKGNFPYE